MRYPTVTNLYKYRALRARRGSKHVRDRRLISSIINEGIWISKPDTFNDPFDCNLRPPRLGIDFDNKLHEFISEMESNPSHIAAKICASIEKEGGSVPQELAEQVISGMWSGDIRGLSLQYAYDIGLDGLWSAVKAGIDKLGVLCLSEHPDNPLLWAHYADEHRGFCIEFERTDSNMLGNENHTFPVRYSKKYPVLTMSDFFVQSSEKQAGATQRPLEETYIGSVLLTKSDHWSYENEWRMIGEGNNLLTEYPGKVSSVIFGLRMSVADRKFLMRCYGKDVKYRQVVMQRGSFSLQIEDQ